jgi:hypothetical protein
MIIFTEMPRNDLLSEEAMHTVLSVICTNCLFLKRNLCFQFELQNAVLEEDFKEAVRLKLALSVATSGDSVSELLSELKVPFSWFISDTLFFFGSSQET